MHLYTPPKPATFIPVVDLTDSFSTDFLKRKAVAWEIHKACRDTGFFYIRNHGIPESVLQEQLGWGQKFFALPMDAKMAIKKQQTHMRRGYEPMLTQILDLGSPADLKEDFQMANHLEPDHPLVRADTPNHGPNLWPNSLPGFREAVEDYHRRTTALGKHLFRCLALSLEMPEDHFDDGLAAPMCSIRLLHYPPQPADASFNQLGAGAHTDWGSITMLLQDANGGLEVKSASGDWISATPIPGTLIVNLGDMVKRWTNDLYHSTLHRVKNISGKERYSVAAFFNPHYHYRVECLPTCRPADDSAPRYEPCTVGEHTAEMARLTYGLKKTDKAPVAAY